ncbi:MAG: type II toxin-antitoxin system RelE/ParE family toxin [Bacteroidota bacterium]|nr:type II toxin-antitoxin system RelE/ParE family toxin [Bacteroidota bacterium]
MNSDFLIATTHSFDRSSIKLSRKYPSFNKDLLELKKILTANPIAGTPLGKNCYKIRLKISSKNTGKSGGARVITFAKVENKRITLLDIYDKADKDSISENELIALIKKSDV